MVLDSEEIFHLENRRLKKELDEAMQETEKVTTMWVEEREECIKIKDTAAKLQSEKDFLEVSRHRAA